MSKRKSPGSTDPAATEPDPAVAGDEAALDEKQSASSTAEVNEPAVELKSDSAAADAEDATAAATTAGTDDAASEPAAEPKPDDTATDAAASVEAEVITSADDASPTELSASAANATAAETEANQSPAPAPRRPWFALLNFLLVIALAGAAAYYWREQQKLDAAYQADIGELRQQLQQKANSSQLRSDLQANLKSGLSPLEDELGKLESKVDELGLGQKSLRESSETLYKLFGRDRNEWQLAEVEYLMRVAQHQLILQDDFVGAAITLQAASDRIGLTGDPGLLPVRVQISEEIADLKTRKRPDLVGMTLILAQLGRQVRSLKPGFAVRVDQPMDAPSTTNQLAADDWLARFKVFLNSLISIRKESTKPSEIEANVMDVASALEDNLKLARWAVLERNARQYQLLLERSLRLFREFYDLDDVDNNDFMTQLQELQKMVINPEKPDITGSLREMQRILSQRENAPPPATEPTAGDSNG